MNPRILYFSDYNRALTWLAARTFTGDIVKRRTSSPSDIIDRKAHLKETIDLFTRKYPPAIVEEDLKKDIPRTKMFVTEPWQKKHYLRGWMIEDSQYAQGDFSGGPFEVIPAKNPCFYDKMNSAYLNNSYQRCGNSIWVAKDDSSCFFITNMHNNDGNKKVAVLYSHHFNVQSIDNRYKTIPLQTLEQIQKKFFFHLNSKTLEKELKELFFIDRGKISINRNILNTFNAKLTFLKNEDAPPRMLKILKPSKNEVALHYAKSIAISVAAGTGYGFGMGFLLGLATFGTGFILCVAIGVVLGIIHGIHHAYMNPLPLSQEKMTLFSHPETVTAGTTVPAQSLKP